MKGTTTNHKTNSLTKSQYPPTPVRIPTELKERLKRVANAEQRSLAGQVIFALQDWMETHDKTESNGK